MWLQYTLTLLPSSSWQFCARWAGRTTGRFSTDAWVQLMGQMCHLRLQRLKGSKKQKPSCGESEKEEKTSKKSRECGFEEKAVEAEDQTNEPGAF